MFNEPFKAQRELRRRISVSFVSKSIGGSAHTQALMMWAHPSEPFAIAK